MRCKLNDFERFNEYFHVEIDLEGASISCPKEAINSELATVGICYSNLDECLGLFFLNESWHFFIGENVFPVAEIERIQRRYPVIGDPIIQIKLKDRTLRARYTFDKRSKWDLTPFVEEEDWGLFFENLILDKNRLSRFRENLTNL